VCLTWISICYIFNRAKNISNKSWRKQQDARLHNVSAWLTIFLRLYKREQKTAGVVTLWAHWRHFSDLQRGGGGGKGCGGGRGGIRSGGMWRRVLCRHVTTFQNNLLAWTSEYSCGNRGNRFIQSVGTYQIILRQTPEDRNLSYLLFSVCATFTVPYEYDDRGASNHGPMVPTLIALSLSLCLSLNW